MSYSSFLRVLASSFLAGEPVAGQVTARARQTLGRPWRWLGPLAKRYVKKFAGGIRPRHSDVVQFLKQDAGLREAWRKYSHELAVKRWLNEPAKMQPVAAAKSWDVPAIESTSAL